MRNRLPLFYTVTAFFWFALYAYVPYVAPFADEMGADFRLSGLIVGAYGFTQMVIRFPLGILSDKLGKRKVFVLLGVFFSALSGLVIVFFPTPMALLAARSLGGVAASAWVIFAILGASYYRPEETVKSVGFLNAANAFGRMAALLVGGLVAQNFGFSSAFLLAGMVGVFGLIAGFGIVENTGAKGKSPSITDLLDVARNRQLMCASILGIFIQYIMFATTFGFSPMAAAEMGASNIQLGMLGVVSTLPGLLISPLAGTVLSRKIGRTLAIGFLMAGLGSAAVSLCQSLWQLYAVQIFSNIGAAAVFTLLMGLCIQDIPSERRATAMGFFQAVYGIGMFLGPFIMGWVSHSFGLMFAFAFTGTIGIIGMSASVFFINKGYLRYG